MNQFVYSVWSGTLPFLPFRVRYVADGPVRIQEQSYKRISYAKRYLSTVVCCLAYENTQYFTSFTFPSSLSWLLKTLLFFQDRRLRFAELVFRIASLNTKNFQALSFAGSSSDLAREFGEADEKWKSWNLPWTWHQHRHSSRRTNSHAGHYWKNWIKFSFRTWKLSP